MKKYLFTAMIGTFMALSSHAQLPSLEPFPNIPSFPYHLSDSSGSLSETEANQLQCSMKLMNAGHKIDAINIDACKAVKTSNGLDCIVTLIGEARPLTADMIKACGDFQTVHAGHVLIFLTVNSYKIGPKILQTISKVTSQEQADCTESILNRTIDGPTIEAACGL